MSDMECHGNGPDHCCYINGGVCQFLEEDTVPGRRWVCGLYRELGDWAAVHSDPRYQAAPIADWFTRTHPGYGCGDYPQHVPEKMAATGRCCFEPVT